MTAFDSLLPTFAAMNRHIAKAMTETASSDPAPCQSAQSVSHPTMHKYVVVRPIFHDTAPPERLIVFDKEIQHRTMVPEGTRAVSAGFVALYHGQVIVPQIGSETLGLDPRPQDKQLLTHFLQH